MLPAAMCEPCAPLGGARHIVVGTPLHNQATLVLIVGTVAALVHRLLTKPIVKEGCHVGGGEVERLVVLEELLLRDPQDVSK